MKVTISNEEVKFLANIILLSDKPTVPTEFTDDWAGWVTSPIVHHSITPREARTILTIVGILTDYNVPVGEIIEKTLETFVTNYKNRIGSSQSQGPLMRQNYSCNICGLKSFVTYDPKGDAFDIVIKIEKDHKEREPTCPCPLDDLNIVGEPTDV